LFYPFWTAQTGQKGILSRPVTLKIIKRLLDYKVILNEPKKANAQSNLIINPDFDFKEMELDLIRALIIDIKMKLEPFDIETRGANTVLINELVEAIDKFSKREEIYTPKQMEKFKSDYEKKTTIQVDKAITRASRKIKSTHGDLSARTT